ncbi:hypothetical protein E2320_018617, partial [Naja naja]
HLEKAVLLTLFPPPNDSSLTVAGTSLTGSCSKASLLDWRDTPERVGTFGRSEVCWLCFFFMVLAVLFSFLKIKTFLGQAERKWPQLLEESGKVPQNPANLFTLLSTGDLLVEVGHLLVGHLNGSPRGLLRQTAGKWGHIAPAAFGVPKYDSEVVEGHGGVRGNAIAQLLRQQLFQGYHLNGTEFTEASQDLLQWESGEHQCHPFQESDSCFRQEHEGIQGAGDFQQAGEVLGHVVPAHRGNVVDGFDG